MFQHRFPVLLIFYLFLCKLMSHCFSVWSVRSLSFSSNSKFQWPWWNIPIILWGQSTSRLLWTWQFQFGKQQISFLLLLFFFTLWFSSLSGRLTEGGMMEGAWRRRYWETKEGGGEVSRGERGGGVALAAGRRIHPPLTCITLLFLRLLPFLLFSSIDASSSSSSSSPRLWVIRCNCSAALPPSPGAYRALAAIFTRSAA